MYDKSFTNRQDLKDSRFNPIQSYPAYLFANDEGGKLTRPLDGKYPRLFADTFSMHDS